MPSINIVMRPSGRIVVQEAVLHVARSTCVYLRKKYSCVGELTGKIHYYRVLGTIISMPTVRVRGLI
ncbi:unnamed protein product [Phytomonas sp. EM1]|nr:unnamed protein product [Phytomonas sp. EM1]|eukprot:CCW64902.1 unnamed protein product [Phytomonas sp. isolate EM1]